MNAVTNLRTDYKLGKTNSIAPQKILLLTNDLFFRRMMVNLSVNKQYLESKLITRASTLSQALIAIEEESFDLICVDYSAVKQNTLTFLEFISKAIPLNANTPKAVLTESIDQISTLERTSILDYAYRVVDKSTKNFDPRKLFDEGTALSRC